MAYHTKICYVWHNIDELYTQSYHGVSFNIFHSDFGYHFMMFTLVGNYVNNPTMLIMLPFIMFNWFCEGRTAGFCALCAIQKHVSRALQSTGRILAPKELVSNLRCILLMLYSWLYAWISAKDTIYLMPFKVNLFIWFFF